MALTDVKGKEEELITAFAKEGLWPIRTFGPRGSFGQQLTLQVGRGSRGIRGTPGAAGYLLDIEMYVEEKETISWGSWITPCRYGGGGGNGRFATLSRRTVMEAWPSCRGGDMYRQVYRKPKAFIPVLFHGSAVLVPFPPSAFLEDIYGKRWRARATGAWHWIWSSHNVNGLEGVGRNERSRQTKQQTQQAAGRRRELKSVGGAKRDARAKQKKKEEETGMVQQPRQGNRAKEKTDTVEEREGRRQGAWGANDLANDAQFIKLGFPSDRRKKTSPSYGKGYREPPFMSFKECMRRPLDAFSMRCFGPGRVIVPHEGGGGGG